MRVCPGSRLMRVPSGIVVAGIVATEAWWLVRDARRLRRVSGASG